MKDWWLGLSQREKIITGLGGTATLLFLLYALVWGPLINKTDRLRQDVNNQAELIAFMKNNVATIQQLRKKQTKPVKESNDSLLTITERSFKTSNLSTFDPQLQQSADKQVKVQFKAIPFRNLLLWIDRLSRSHAISVAKISIQPIETAGDVKADITLTKL